MNYGITAIVADCDYTLLQPPITKFVRPFYRVARGMGGEQIERFLNLSHSLVGSLIEYFIEELLFRFPLYTPIPLVSPETLAEAHKRYGIGVFSRRPCAWRDITQLGYDKSIDVFVGREEIGMEVIRGEHIARCVQQFGKPSSTLVVSDSPRDIKKGKLLGAITCAIVSYHSENELRRHNPNMVLPSFQELLLSLNSGNINF